MKDSPMEQQPDRKRARAAFNMVALHLAGYTYDQIELFRPSALTEDNLHTLLIKKLTELLGEWAVKQHLKIEPTSKRRKSPRRRK